MPFDPPTFLRLARSHFDFLIADFQYSVSEQVGQGWVRSATVCYDTPKVGIEADWNTRDGISLRIAAKQDTFWIRPNCSHGFDISELLRLVAPSVLKAVPDCQWPDETESEIDAWLTFHARQLRAYGEPLLKGDLSLCEDMLIMRYCNSSKSLLLDDYFRLFREECASLPPEDRGKLQAAMETRSPRQVSYLLQDWINKGRLRSVRLSTALGDLTMQHLQ
jgi:hypothetical protein